MNSVSELFVIEGVAQSPMAQWMLACVVFAACIAIATWRIDALLRMNGRQTRHLWSAAILVVIGWSVLAPTLFTAQRILPVSPLPAPTTVLQPGVVAPTAIEAPSISSEQLLVAAWCIASALLLLRLAIAVVHLVQLRKRAARTVVDGHDVLLTNNVGPAVIGGQRGEILIPSWLLEFEAPLRALVFRHEQEHRNARDPFLLWSSLVVTALLPWNVPLWWMSRRLRLSLEIDCDARTLAGDTDRRRYAQLLLLIAQKHTHVPFASTLAGRESGLSHRISIMMKAPSAGSRLRMSVSAMIACVFVAAACSTRIASNLTSPSPETVVEVKAPAAVSIADSTPPVAAPVDSTKVVQQAPVSVQRDSRPPYFDFQTEKPATAIPGVSPIYPAALRAAGVTGVELIQVVVRPDSMADMRTFKVLKSAHVEFTAAVKEALAKMKFSPATVEGRTVSQLVQLPFAFGNVEVPPRSVADRPTVERGRVTSPARAGDPNAPYFDFQVEKPAMVLPGVHPTYPPDLRERKIEGTVLAQFVVSADGVPDVNTFKVLKSDDPAFAEAVRAALADMRFSPAQLSDGTKVKQLLQQPFGFRINQ